MRKLALFLAAIFALPCLASCQKGKKDPPGKKVSEDSTWWNDTITTIEPDEIKSAVKGKFSDVSVGYTCPDEDSVILMFSLCPEEMGQPAYDILRQYSYDGKLLGQVILNDSLGSEDYQFESSVFTLGDKYYANITTYNEENESYDQLAYEVDFENSKLKDPITLSSPVPQDDYQHSVSAMTSVGDELVYLVYNSERGKVTYQVYVNKGSDFRDHTLDFGRETELEDISDFQSNGKEVQFLARTLEGGHPRTYYCTLDIHSFELKKTPIENADYLDQLIFSSDNKALLRENHQLSALDLATGNKTSFLQFKDSYAYDIYDNARILRATDNEVVLYKSDQNNFGMNATTSLIKLTKADKNPNAGRKLLSLAYFSDLGEAEYTAINEFNKSSKDHFIETTDKYYEIVEAEFDESSGKTFLAQQLSGQVNAMDMLISDIKSGTGPDLVIFDSQYEKLNNTDYLIDLTKRIESQESLHSGDYMDFVLSPNGRDGKHYRLTYEYLYNAFFVNKSFLSDGAKGLTFPQYDQLIEERNIGKSVLYEDELVLLQELVKASDCFTYDESGKVSLKTDNFRAIAEYVASIPDNLSYDDGMLGLTNVLMFQYMGAAELTNMYGNLYTTHSIIGMPSPDAHAETILGVGIGITSTCSDQDGAWEFAMKLLAPEAQRRLLRDPVMKSVQRENLLSLIQQYNDSQKRSWSPERLSDEYADWYIAELSDAIVVPDINPTIMMIISEEMPPYFAGDKTLDEVISVIENRANLVLNEQGQK